MILHLLCCLWPPLAGDHLKTRTHFCSHSLLKVEDGLEFRFTTLPTRSRMGRVQQKGCYCDWISFELVTGGSQVQFLETASFGVRLCAHGCSFPPAS